MTAFSNTRKSFFFFFFFFFKKNGNFFRLELAAQLYWHVSIWLWFCGCVTFFTSLFGDGGKWLVFDVGNFGFVSPLPAGPSAIFFNQIFGVKWLLAIGGSI